MLDWAPVVVGVVLFVLLSPGLLIEAPPAHGRAGLAGCRAVPTHRAQPQDRACRWVDFGSLRVTGKATVHTILFFAIFLIVTMACNLHIYTGA
ncbi:unnamed protein product [Miscanthus lutarioriparius]|uniref:Uncharacterized protein n=1 Tax=Miscanthus lutarioriparius TaxID=422564 RepID=A0A811R2Z2_9POAL|nr:unnamed protein product [Miscanthus lutarioriparius]